MIRLWQFLSIHPDCLPSTATKEDSVGAACIAALLPVSQRCSSSSESTFGSVVELSWWSLFFRVSFPGLLLSSVVYGIHPALRRTYERASSIAPPSLILALRLGLHAGGIVSSSIARSLRSYLKSLLLDRSYIGVVAWGRDR